MLFQGSYVPCVVGTMLPLTFSQKNQNELARATVLRVDQHIFVGSYAPQKMASPCNMQRAPACSS
jgi:hypothetical protein